MMGAVSTAAGRQAGVVVSQSCGQRAEQKKREEQNGSAAPHMELSLQEQIAGRDPCEKRGRHSGIIW
jgi:hypothetical protein